MSNALKELAVSYPFMPDASTPASLKRIKDVRIVYILPAADMVEPGRHSLEHYAELISISEDEAIFKIVCVVFGVDEQVTVPVIVGIDAVPTTNSYVLVDEPVTYSGTHSLHPDCLLFLQLAPRLSVVERTNVTKEGTAVYSDPVPVSGPTVKINNGHNVRVSGSTSNIRFSGGAGAGKGLYEELPFIDITPEDLQIGQGLRSINGLTHNVNIIGDTSARVQSFSGITIQITPNPVPED